jgi:hypothetical protein
MHCLFEERYKICIVNCTSYDGRNARLRNSGEKPGDVCQGDKSPPFANRFENGFYCGRNRGQRLVYFAFNSAKAVGVTKIRLELIDALQNI